MRIGAVLALTGRFARFGTQAAEGLRTWHDLTGLTEPPDIVDDGSAPGRVGPALDELAARCDLLLGPYGTSTARAAATWARERDRLVWNHGGAGRDVQDSAPGRLVSLITPTDRSGEPFVRWLATRHPGTPLDLVAGPGTFGPLVVDGMRRVADGLGVPVGTGTGGPGTDGRALFAAGTFEHDTALVRDLATPPAVLGTVAAGVAAFAEHVPDPDGVLGLAQWIPGARPWPELGPDEAGFLARYRERTGTAPDYPGVQAAAAATVAMHCARLAGSTADDALFAAATGLRTSTFYGGFAIDPVTGAQTGHDAVLTRWRGGRIVPEPL